MFTFVRSILSRLGGYESRPTALDPESSVDSRNAALEYIAQQDITIDEKCQSIADAVVTTLLTSSGGGPELASQLQSLVAQNDNVNGWTERLALAVFSGLANALEIALKIGEPMGNAMADAYQKVASTLKDMAQEAGGFAEENPVYATLLALGVLVCLAPWAVEALGFGELGPIEGTFAAWWQARYAGYVPKESLFSFFQRLGMVWRLYVKK